MARRLRIEGVDCRRRGKNRRAREESGELRIEIATGSRRGRDVEVRVSYRLEKENPIRSLR